MRLGSSRRKRRSRRDDDSYSSKYKVSSQLLSAVSGNRLVAPKYKVSLQIAEASRVIDYLRPSFDE